MHIFNQAHAMALDELTFPKNAYNPHKNIAKEVRSGVVIIEV